MLMSRSWIKLWRLLSGCLLAAALAAAATHPAIAATTKTGDAPVILVVGDSLSAGYGVNVEATWVALLAKRLAGQGYVYRVVNASVSGETTGGARARLPRALKLHQPAIVILELGGNDGLRGLPLSQMRGNLAAMIEGARAAQARTVLVGMRIPVNYGPAYAAGFHDIYAELAKQYDLPLVPFFLQDVALNPELMQDDGIHPNRQAQPILLDSLWPALRPLLKK